MSMHCLHFQLNSVDKFSIRKVRSVVVAQRKTHVTQEKKSVRTPRTEQSKENTCTNLNYNCFVFNKK